MILVHLQASHNIDIEILTKPQYNDLSDYMHMQLNIML